MAVTLKASLLVVVAALALAGCGEVRTPYSPSMAVQLEQQGDPDDCSVIPVSRYIRRQGQLYVIDCD